MTSTDLVKRTQETVALIDHPQFLAQIEALLPEDVSLTRFVQVAKTAIRSNPDLVKADQNTLFASLIRCAQDALYPDGHEAVLVTFGDKVAYLPMVYGVIRVARDYGWMMRAEAVYENDVFEWLGSDAKPLHRHPRPGDDRGDLVAAYAYATNGREKLARVLYAPDIEKRKAKARAKNVWNEWPEAMWRKSAAHALYRELPRSEHDRPERFAEIDDPADAVAKLYGPDGTEFLITSHHHSLTDGTTAAAPAANAEPPAGGSQQAGDAETPAAEASPVPGDLDEDDPEPQPAAAETEVDLGEIGKTVIPAGYPWSGQNLTEVAAAMDGREWIAWAVRNGDKFTPDFYGALSAFVVAWEKQAAA